MPDEHDEPAYEKYREARAAFAARDLIKAEQLFKESLKMQEHFKALELLGECMFHQGKTAEAITALRRATFLGKESKAPFLLAKAYLAENNVVESQPSHNSAEGGVFP